MLCVYPWCMAVLYLSLFLSKLNWQHTGPSQMLSNQLSNPATWYTINQPHWITCHLILRAFSSTIVQLKHNFKGYKTSGTVTQLMSQLIFRESSSKICSNKVHLHETRTVFSFFFFLSLLQCTLVFYFHEAFTLLWIMHQYGFFAVLFQGTVQFIMDQSALWKTPLGYSTQECSGLPPKVKSLLKIKSSKYTIVCMQVDSEFRKFLAHAVESLMSVVIIQGLVWHWLSVYNLCKTLLQFLINVHNDCAT